MTLKFQVIAGCACAAIFATAVSTYFQLSATQSATRQLLLKQDADHVEGTARLIATKIQTLQFVLGSVASVITPRLLRNPAALENFMANQHVLNAIFEHTFIARRDGSMVLAMSEGVAQSSASQYATDEAFARSASGTPAVSRAFVAPGQTAPLVSLVVPITSGDGTVIASLGGSLKVRSAGLLSFMMNADPEDASRELVVDLDHTILAHPDVNRVMGRGENEPGLANTFSQWARSGHPLNPKGHSGLSDDYLVSMAAVPSAKWLLLRMTPQALALQPVLAGTAAAWRVGVSVGLVAALLAALLAYKMTRPISRLQVRAERLLADPESGDDQWPDASGEVGALSRVFQHFIKQVQVRQGETHDMLRRLEAVLHHADIGVAFTRLSRFELVSRDFCQMLGCEEADLMGQPTRVMYASDEDYQALATRAKPEFIETGGFDGEQQLMRRNGEMFWAHMRGRAITPGIMSGGTIWIVEDVTRAREQRERLHWSASHDSLTGLANRAAFEMLLNEATGRAGEQSFCALFIDLDRFKQVNDTAGHAAGDVLLRDIAHKLEGAVRKSDTVARLGGDEFAVLLHRCPSLQAREIAEKLRDAVESYVLVWTGSSHSVGASIGMVEVDASFNTGADVMKAADEACYAAKRHGRNRVVEYSRTLPASDVPIPGRAA